MNRPFLLLVEDDPNDEELMLRALRKRGEVRVVVARDGAAALQHLFSDAETTLPRELPAAVFLDLNLPKIGGLEVLRRIRERADTQLLPVVILSSSTLESDLLSSYRGGANSYVVKPVDSEQFAETVQQIGAYWLRLNQPLPD